MRALDAVTQDQIKADIPEFREGDSVRVNVRVVDYKDIKGGKVGKRERLRQITGGAQKGA